jgi:predicted HicB family RNase H-like nuclease
MLLTWKQRFRHKRGPVAADRLFQVFPERVLGKEPKMEMVEHHVVSKEAQVYRVATELYEQKPDWVTFFREVLGVDGLIRRHFPNQIELNQFEQTKEYTDIQQMVAKLREGSGEPAENREPTRVITVRLPKSLHESLRTEAHERKTSMNKLCISKLLQMVDSELIPSD